MSAIKFVKRVGTLPSPLTPDTFYLVRVGAGFDLYCSDMTGGIAHPLNVGLSVAGCWPMRPGKARVVGDTVGAVLTTLALTASRLHFIPMVAPRRAGVAGLRISVTTAAAGTASIGIYNNGDSIGYDAPGALLASVTGLDTGTTGDKTGTLAYTFEAGRLYWLAVIASAAATLRALAVGSVQTALGRQANNTGAISHLFAGGVGSTLPNPAPATLTDGNGAVPAIYLVE